MQSEIKSLVFFLSPLPTELHVITQQQNLLPWVHEREVQEHWAVPRTSQNSGEDESAKRGFSYCCLPFRCRTSAAMNITPYTYETAQSKRNTQAWGEEQAQPFPGVSHVCSQKRQSFLTLPWTFSCPTPETWLGFHLHPNTQSLPPSSVPWMWGAKDTPCQQARSWDCFSWTSLLQAAGPHYKKPLFLLQSTIQSIVNTSFPHRMGAASWATRTVAHRKPSTYGCVWEDRDLGNSPCLYELHWKHVE